MTISTPGQAIDAIRRYMILNEATLPASMVDAVRPYVSYGAPAVGLIPMFTEAVYAYRDTMDAAAREIAEACGSRFAYWSLAGGRGELLAAVLRGETVVELPPVLDQFGEPE